MTDVPRVLFVSDDEDDARIGAVQAPYRLAELLREHGWESDLLFQRHLGAWPEPARQRGRMLLSPWLAHRMVERAWRSRGPYDVIEAEGAEGFILGLLRRRSCYRSARLVVRSHGLHTLDYADWWAHRRHGLLQTPWYRRLGYPFYRLTQEAGAYRLADAAIVQSRLEAEFLARWHWKQKHEIHQIPHGVRQFRCDQAPAPGAPRGGGILFSGSWYPCKGFHYLAAAYARLAARGVPPPLTLLSNAVDEPGLIAPEDARIRSSFSPETQATITVAQRVHDREAVFAMYRNFDFLVLPSTLESFGLVVLEALSQRLPVIVTSACGVADYLRNDVDALIVPPRDPVALAAAMSRLWTDAPLRQRLAEAGHQTVRRMTWARAAQATIAAYRGEAPAPLPYP